MGSLSLLPRSFPIQELNQGFLHCSWTFYRLSYKRSPSTVRTVKAPNGSRAGKSPTRVKVKVKSESEVVQLCLTAYDSIDGNLPGSPVHGIFQARILEWAAISYSKGSFQPRDRPTSLVSPALAGEFFTTSSPGKPVPFNRRIRKEFTIVLNMPFSRKLFLP